jgi:hypothetical protein
MKPLNSPMDIIKLLPKTNCRDCGQPTCMAFAVTVIKGEKGLDACPHLDAQVINQYQTPAMEASAAQIEQQKAEEALRQKIRELDMLERAELLGATISGDCLVIRCLGKDFLVDPNGDIKSECHIIPWVTGPILNYVLKASGTKPTGDWVPFRELKGGPAWGRFFYHRCEKALKKVIDQFTNLFEFMIDVFNAKPADDAFQSDIAVVIHPLPKLPILICYWKSDGDLEASLNLFFDAKAEDNLEIEQIYTLGVGLVNMFEKISQTHGE